MKARKIKLPKGLDIEELRWRRDLAARDGDRDLAFACALAIDRIKYGKPKKTSALVARLEGK